LKRALITCFLLLVRPVAALAVEPEPIVFVVSYHNLDYAKTGWQRWNASSFAIPENLAEGLKIRSWMRLP
jgi:hypothetical protein